MKGDLLPSSDHIARLCSPKHAPMGKVQASAFLLKKNEPNLSVDWLEILGCQSREKEILKMREVYNRRLDVKKNARIAVLNVGKVCKKIHTESPDNRKIEILHDPNLEDDISHSEIKNLRQNDVLIAELILETVCETHHAKL